MNSSEQRERVVKTFSEKRSFGRIVVRALVLHVPDLPALLRTALQAGGGEAEALCATLRGSPEPTFRLVQASRVPAGNVASPLEKKRVFAYLVRAIEIHERT